MPAETAAAEVAGVLLAAGGSRRMGVNKLLLSVDGESLIRRSARSATAAGLAPLLVVLGHDADRVRNEIRNLDCRVVENEQWARGMASSLVAGISALPESSAAAIILLADMPLVTAAMIAAVANRFRKTRARLVVSLYGASAAPPMLFGRALFGELLELTGDRGALRVAERHRNEAETLTWPADSRIDLDSAADRAAFDAGRQGERK